MIYCTRLGFRSRLTTQKGRATCCPTRIDTVRVICSLFTALAAAAKRSTATPAPEQERSFAAPHQRNRASRSPPPVYACPAKVSLCLAPSCRDVSAGCYGRGHASLTRTRNAGLGSVSINLTTTRVGGSGLLFTSSTTTRSAFGFALRFRGNKAHRIVGALWTARAERRGVHDYHGVLARLAVTRQRDPDVR